MNAVKAPKPEYNFIDTATLSDQVNALILEYCSLYGIDINNYKERTGIKHNEVNNILRYCYKKLFKPEKPLYNNQASNINYDDIEQLHCVVDVFLDICMFFNKALGLFSFSIFTGIASNTLSNWVNNGETLNPERLRLLKSIQEYNQGALISNLKDTPVGALAVANNDHETGLEWSKNQMQVTAQSVYFLPSERVDRMRLAKPEDNNDSV